jgi:hypothetical protein
MGRHYTLFLPVPPLFRHVLQEFNPQTRRRAFSRKLPRH